MGSAAVRCGPSVEFLAAPLRPPSAGRAARMAGRDASGQSSSSSSLLSRSITRPPKLGKPGRPLPRGSKSTSMGRLRLLVPAAGWRAPPEPRSIRACAPVLAEPISAPRSDAARWAGTGLIPRSAAARSGRSTSTAVATESLIGTCRTRRKTCPFGCLCPLRSSSVLPCHTWLAAGQSANQLRGARGLIAWHALNLWASGGFPGVHHRRQATCATRPRHVMHRSTEPWQ